MSDAFNKVENYIFGSKRKIKEIPENARQEMEKSLKMVDDFDLYSIDVSELWEPSVTMDWDVMKFKKWAVKKDKIWNYIMINGMKCREYQPWISWFVYYDRKDRYHYGEWLEIWFCDKWNFIKSVVIEDSWHPKESDLFPTELSRLLWWPLYEVDQDPARFYSKKSEKWGLSKLDKVAMNIRWSDIYKLESEFTYNDVNHLLHNDWIMWKDKEGKYMSLNGEKFRKFTPGASGLMYTEFMSKWLHEPSIFLAEYKDGEIIGEWIVLWVKKKHIIRK